MFINHQSSIINRCLVILLFLAVVGLQTRDAQGGLFGRSKPAVSVASADTLIPGTTYYYPSGLQSDADSWYNVGPASTAPSLYGFGLSVDSIAGFDADSSILTIKAIFGFENSSDTVAYYYGDDNIVENWVIWSDTTTTLARTDLGRLINCGLPVHERRRYMITAQDTLLLRTFYEIPAKP